MIEESGSLVRRWFPYWRPKPEARIRLFCLPFAGGSASVFHRWADFGPWVDVLSVQYPGRETRLSEPLCHRVPELVEALGPVMGALLDRPFAFFGYSLGTYVCLELTRWLERMKSPAPLGLLLAAGTPPHQERLRRLHDLSQADFMAELQRYGGTPRQVLEHEELMELLFPILRADFEMVEEYEALPSPKLSLPMAVWGGAEDLHPSPASLERWCDFTTGDFVLQILSGGHFFLNSSRDRLMEDVERRVLRWSGQDLPPA